MRDWYCYMDGRGLTRAGKICGIVGVCIDALQLVFLIVYLIILGSVFAFQN